MKIKIRFFITLILLCASQASFTQAYTPFPDSNAVWSVLDFTSYYPDSTQYQTKLYGLIDDTIINTVNYCKLYFNDGLIDSTIEVSSSNTSYLCAIRQDTLLKKVYFIPKDSINELILYDFNINAGDTFFMHNELGYEVKAWCTGRNPFLISGEVRNIFYIETDFVMVFNHTLVEGVGNIRGLFETCYPYSHSKGIMCLTVNDSIFYKYDGNVNWGIWIDTSIYKSCYNNGMIITDSPLLEIFKNYVNVSPNPLINSTVITIPEILKPNIITIEIFDLQGRKVKKYLNLNSRQLTLYRTDFNTAGMYIVRIKSDKYLETIKLLVQ